MKDLVKTGILLLVIASSVFLLGMTGRGLSGAYLVGLLLFLLIIFLALAFQHDKEIVSYRVSDKLLLCFEILLVSIVAVVWISIVDFYFVEMFKNLGLDLNDNTYWVIFFGGIIPIFFAIIAVVYFLGSHHFSNTIRILIFFVFFANSNINDFLYYILLNEPLPKLWTWIYQPIFLFGNSITTVQLVCWSALALAMGFIAFLLPYEALTLDNLDNLTNNKRTKGEKISELLLVIIFSVASIYYAYTIVPKIKQSVQTNNPVTQATLRQESIDQAEEKFPEPKSDYAKADKERIDLANKIINYLNNYYVTNNSYPISKGNCISKWDSSSKVLPFSIEGVTLADPEQGKGKECDFNGGSKNILYYSDSKRFALLMPGDTIPDDYANIYIPVQRDVYWFNDDVLFFRDWSWDNRIIVYMYNKGVGVTHFISPEGSDINYEKK